MRTMVLWLLGGVGGHCTIVIHSYQAKTEREKGPVQLNIKVLCHQKSTDQSNRTSIIVPRRGLTPDSEEVMPP